MKVLITLFAAVVFSLVATSCASNDGPKPAREKINRIPQNQPAAWEGQAGFGLPTSY